jgi:glycosyltransferase involved in cell wall biosynthesis
VRNRILSQALALNHDVVDLISPSSSRLVGNLTVGLRYLARDRRDFDLVVVGFPGHLLVPWVRLWTRAPILFDPFVSVYDTFCLDRRRFSPRSIPGRLAFALDARSGRWADRLLLDTRAHLDFYAHTFGLPREKMAVVYVGCDEALFYPRPAPPPSPGDASASTFHVFTYTSFLRLHGVEQILYAASQLEGCLDARQRPIAFTIAGDGTYRVEMERLAAELGLRNVRFPGWLPYEQLPACIAAADLCLGGHFSDVPKAARVIATKTYQFIAMRKPTIVADNPATREVFVPGSDVWGVPMGSARALADAIQTLAGDPGLRQHLANGGYETFQKCCTTRAIANQLAPILEETACASAS